MWLHVVVITVVKTGGLGSREAGCLRYEKEERRVQCYKREALIGRGRAIDSITTDF